MLGEGRSQSPRYFLKAQPHLPTLTPQCSSGLATKADPPPNPRGPSDPFKQRRKQLPTPRQVWPVIPGLLSLAFCLVHGLEAQLGLKNCLGITEAKRGRTLWSNLVEATSWVPHVARWHFHSACNACCSPWSQKNKTSGRSTSHHDCHRSWTLSISVVGTSEDQCPDQWLSDPAAR